LVLFPGQEFDFNATVGPRDEAHGYQVAKVIAEGELVDGIGGGTCQISGTLHAAVFFAGLDILERYPHTRPSSYMKMGLDAAVAYPTMNFRFRNSSSLPIVIHETVTGGVVRAEIRGAQVGPAVTLIRRIESSTNYDELERADNRVPFGKRVLLQRGVPGFKLKRYRVVRDEQYGVRDMWRDTYPPTSQIVLVGQTTRIRRICRTRISIRSIWPMNCWCSPSNGRLPTSPRASANGATRVASAKRVGLRPRGCPSSRANLEAANAGPSAAFAICPKKLG